MGEDSRRDDVSILDSERLFRRVTPNQVVPGHDGTPEPSSAVFKTEEMSVNLESLMQEQGRAPEDTLRNHPDHFLTSITAGRVRVFKYPIVKDNAPPHDPAHALVLGKKSGSFAKEMKRQHRWIVAP